MVQQNNTGTSISNVQKTIFNAKDTTPSMEWSEEQQEILRDCLEDQVANEEYYSSFDEPHGFSCNCTECN